MVGGPAAEADLGFPTLPDALAERLTEQGEWCFATRTVERWPYEFDLYVDEADRPDLEDYALLAHAGHGVNSYAIHYYLVCGPVRLFLQLVWGGAYMDPTETAKHVRQCFELADEIVTTAAGGRIRNGSWVTVVASDFYGSRWWRSGQARPPLAPSTEVRGWLLGTRAALAVQLRAVDD